MSDDRRGTFIPIVSGRFEPVDEGEAAAMGRALIAKLRGEALTPSERALLTRARSEAPEDARAPTPTVAISETLLALDRGPSGEVRVSWRQYKGSAPFLDIRRWERSEDGQLHPTRQGVTIRARELSRLLTVLVPLARRAEQDDGP